MQQLLASHSALRLNTTASILPQIASADHRIKPMKPGRIGSLVQKGEQIQHINQYFMGLISLISCVLTTGFIAIVAILFTMLFLQKLFEWIVSHIPFFVTWEDKGNIIKIASVVRSNFFSINLFKRPNYLTSKDGFPTPYYYTNMANGKQSSSIFIKQILTATMKVSKELTDIVENVEDPSYELMEAFKMTEDMTQSEVINSDIILRNITKSQTYDFVMESMFGELIVNGENPYAIKHLKPAEKGLAQLYQQNLFETIKKEQLNQELLSKIDFGFDFVKLPEVVSTGNSDLYVLELEDLRDLYTQEPFENLAQIQVLKEVKHVPTKLQFPYAVFAKAKCGPQKGFICIAAVFRYTSTTEGTPAKFVTISPFFSKLAKNKSAWAVTRCHIAHAHFNDFTFRTHLGVLHLATSQYNVPLYNYLNSTTKKDKVQKFFTYAFEPFNRGLEGVNMSAFKTLIHPLYPLVSNVFTVATDKALALINIETARIDFNAYNPENLARKNGLEDFLKDGESEIYFDSELYKVLSEYIGFVYDITGMGECQKEIIAEINKTITPEGTNRNVPIRDLKAFFCNMAFCWVIYHSHTFSNLSLASYFRFRPSIMSKELPREDKEWLGVNEKEYLPVPKMLMESMKLDKSVTLRDAGNMLTSVIARLSFKAKKEGDVKISDAIHVALRKFEDIEDNLEVVNEKRQNNGIFGMVWLNPHEMQASLNI